MRRIRAIKPEILDDEKTASFSHAEWRTFVSLWLLADDHGGLRGDAGYIRGAAFWATDDTREDVANILETLAKSRVITRYEVRGQVYIRINNWTKHQRVDKPSKPRVPLFEDKEAKELRLVARNSRNPRESSRETLEPSTTDRDLGSGIRDREYLSVFSPKSPPARDRKTKTKLPDSWQPSPGHAELARQLSASVSEQAKRFRDHFAANGKPMADWDAAFRNWLRRSVEFSNGAKNKGFFPSQQEQGRPPMPVLKPPRGD